MWVEKLLSLFLLFYPKFGEIHANYFVPIFQFIEDY